MCRPNEQQRGLDEEEPFLPQQSERMLSEDDFEEYNEDDGATAAVIMKTQEYQGGPEKEKDWKIIDKDADLHRRRLLLAKGVYFFVFAADACWEPFAAVLLSKRNISHAAIGAMLTSMTIANAVCGQLFTALADKYSAHRNIALTGFSLFVMCTCALVFSEKPTYTACMTILAQCAWGPVLPMTDNVTMQIVRKAKREDYSRQRLFAAIAWAVFCVTDGLLMDMYGYKILFYILSVLGFIALVLLSYYPFKEFGSSTAAPHTTKIHLNKPPSTQQQTSSWTDLVSLVMHNVLMLPFLSVVLCTGYLFSTIDGYLALYIISLGGNSFLVGAMFAVASIVEIPLFNFSDRFYAKIGMKWVFCLTTLAYFIRVISYSLLKNPYYVLFIEPFHALTISLFWGPSVSFINDHLLANKPELKATGQGSFFAAFYTGRAIGYSVSGWLSTMNGLRSMFRSSLGAVALLSLLVANFWRLATYYNARSAKNDALNAANWAQEWCDEATEKNVTSNAARTSLNTADQQEASPVFATRVSDFAATSSGALSLHENPETNSNKIGHDIIEEDNLLTSSTEARSTSSEYGELMSL